MAQMAGLDPTQSGSGYWIDFAEARRAVDTLVDLAHDEPDERPPCVILVGQQRFLCGRRQCPSQPLLGV